MDLIIVCQELQQNNEHLFKLIKTVLHKRTYLRYAFDFQYLNVVCEF